MSAADSDSGFPTIWEKFSWNGETAWTSVCENVRAIVSEERSRLVYLGSNDGLVNLLNAPQFRVLPDDPSLNRGGHRFWLGPQHRWKWPPPADWEYAPAMSCSVDHGVLMLHHVRMDSDYPALTREYAWEGRRLRCSVRWKDDGRPYFGMHVIAVDRPFTITARLESCDAAPAGLVIARMVDEVPAIQFPHPAISVSEGYATVRAGIRETKLGFVPQTLATGRPDGWSLSMHPGPSGGAGEEMPDHGYLSQVWVGDESSEFAEIEQLTSNLQGCTSEECFSTIYLEASQQVF
jgi:hypothetical protein